MFEDGFGNSRVTGLKEISLPEPVSMTPETSGWWILAGIAAAWLAYFGYRLYRRWQSNVYRRIALTELAKIESDYAQGESRGLTQLPILLKRTAMHAFGRDRIAELTGTVWLAFLDRTGGTNSFSHGPGQTLGTLAYNKTEMIDSETISKLLLLTREWIKGHNKRNMNIQHPTSNSEL